MKIVIDTNVVISAFFFNGKPFELLKMVVNRSNGIDAFATGPDEALRPRNIALLMFNEDPERFFRGARTEFVDIPDPTGGGMVEKVFSGAGQPFLQWARVWRQSL